MRLSRPRKPSYLYMEEVDVRVADKYVVLIPKTPIDLLMNLEEAYKLRAFLDKYIAWSTEGAGRIHHGKPA